MSIRYYALLCLVLLGFCGLSTATDKLNPGQSTPGKPKLVVTIKPLAMIARDIGGDRVSIEQLLPTNRSPHSYSLKISDRTKLQQADLLLWVGESLDGFAGKLVSPGQISIAADQLPGISWPAAEDDVHHHHEDEHEHHDGCVHHDGGDPHIWLNPENVAIIAAELAARLSDLDPANRLYYQQASERFTSALEAFDRDAQQQLAALPKRQFVVQHDAYGHFINRYQLQQLGSLRSLSGAKAGTKTMAHLLNKGLEQSVHQGEGGLSCILSDPQFNPKAALTFAERTGVKLLSLDPQGTQVEINSSELAYPRFLQTFVDTFTDCLQ